MAEQQGRFPGIEALTMNDIATWTGQAVASRGQGYQRDGRVEDLSITADGTLLADVHGSDLYSVVVYAGEDGRLQSVCSCPYGFDCKHGVAALLEYLERLKKGQSIEAALSNDPRLQLRETDFQDSDFQESDFGEEDWRQQSPEGPEPAGPEPAGPVPSTKKELSEHTGIENYLAELSKKQLISWILRLAKDIPQVQTCLREDVFNRRTDDAALRKSLRQEMQRLSRIDPWSDPWSNRGNIPNYSSLRRKMRALLDAGSCDALLEEGRELLHLGKEQIERSNDEGETCGEIADCVPLLLEALRASTLSEADKLLWALDAVLEDDFDVCAPLRKFLEEPQPPEAWNLAANSLAEQLKALPASQSEYSVQYQRDTVSAWLIRALEHSGRDAEILPLCAAEAKAAGNYKRLVSRLMQEDRDAEALQWTWEGLKAMKEHSQGYVHGLRDCQREIYRKQEDWQSLLLLEVEEFLRRPNSKDFAQCRVAAEANQTWPDVRQALLGFLASGVVPWEHKNWPSSVRQPDPIPDSKHEPSDFPLLFPLIGIAIQEKLPEDIVRWYALLPQMYGLSSFHDEVAAAVQEAFPEQSIRIWKRLTQDSVARTTKSAYAEAGGYLRKMRKCMHARGLEREWAPYVIFLRTQHARKRLFLAVLDSMDEKPLLQQ